MCIMRKIEASKTNITCHLNDINLNKYLGIKGLPVHVIFVLGGGRH